MQNQLVLSAGNSSAKVMIKMSQIIGVVVSGYEKKKG